MLPAEKKIYVESLRVDKPSDPDSDDIRRLKRALAECRASVILVAKTIDDQNAEMLALTQEIQELKLLANRWVEFQNSKIFVFYRAYLAAHRVPVIGRMLRTLKRPLLAILGKRHRS